MSRKIILVGKAGSGKDFFRDYMSSQLIIDVSFTTRPPREGEIPGYTYHFVSEHEFQNLLLGEQLHEYVVFNGWRYATGKVSWHYSDVFIMTPSGVSQLLRKDREKCTIVYFDINLNTRRERLELRSDADVVTRRLLSDDIDFSNYMDFDIRVTNPEYNADQLYSLINLYDKCATQ